MKISKKMTLMALGLFAAIGITQIALETYADARAGGGRSGGFRGSRSFQAPSRPAQPANREEKRLRHPSNLDKWRHSPAASCADLAPRFSEGFSARCSFQV